MHPLILLTNIYSYCYLVDTLGSSLTSLLARQLDDMLLGHVPDVWLVVGEHVALLCVLGATLLCVSEHWPALATPCYWERYLFIR